MAAEWCDYLESHARRIYSLPKSPSFLPALIVAGKLKQGDLKNGFTARDVYRRCWAGVGLVELTNAALARLVETNWLREEPHKPTSKGGCPTITYLVNPKISGQRRTEQMPSGSTEAT